MKMVMKWVLWKHNSKTIELTQESTFKWERRKSFLSNFKNETGEKREAFESQNETQLETKKTNMKK